MAAAATTFNQEFVTFHGDAPSPIFTVLDSTGAVVDISGATEISWSCQAQSEAAAPALTLTKTGGGISFVTTGTDGKFQVLLSAANTAALTGAYQHSATVTIAGKAITAIAGRMLVGQDYSYNPSQIATVPLFQVRRLVGDILPDAWQLTDSEILWALVQYGSIYTAAADCCRYIAGQYARKVDTTNPGSIQTAAGEQWKHYAELAVTLDAQGRGRGAGIVPYMGGYSVTDKIAVQNNADRVQPSFTIGMMDNWLPVGQVGNESFTQPATNPGP